MVAYVVFSCIVLVSTLKLLYNPRHFRPINHLMPWSSWVIWEALPSPTMQALFFRGPSLLRLMNKFHLSFTPWSYLIESGSLWVRFKKFSHVHQVKRKPPGLVWVVYDMEPEGYFCQGIKVHIERYLSQRAYLQIHQQLQMHFIWPILELEEFFSYLIGTFFERKLMFSVFIYSLAIIVIGSLFQDLQCCRSNLG